MILHPRGIVCARCVISVAFSSLNIQFQPPFLGWCDSPAEINLVVLGHVDAGKSTLMGRLRFHLGEIGEKEKRRIDKEAKDSGKAKSAWAWCMDERKEERERGVTMDVSVARLTTNRRTFTLLDAPGHKDYSSNAVTGAAQADAALLVIDASPGEFEKGVSEHGQTREHANLARGLGAVGLVAVVNKMDAAEEPRIQRFAVIRDHLLELFTAIGFDPSRITIVPASAQEGINLIENADHDWANDSPSLLQALDALDPPRRELKKPLRMLVAESFASRTLGGDAFSARVETGHAGVNDRLLAMPGGHSCIIKSMESLGSKCKASIPLSFLLTSEGEYLLGVSFPQEVWAGNTVEMALDPSEGVAGKGSVLCDPRFPVPLVIKLRASIKVVESSPMPVVAGSNLLLFLGFAEEPATVSAINSSFDPSTGGVVKEHPRALPKGKSGSVDINLER